MASSERYPLGRRGKMHPLFVELYLTDDEDEDLRGKQRAQRKKRAIKGTVATRTK
jgi:hypothetical protein